MIAERIGIKMTHVIMKRSKFLLLTVFGFATAISVSCASQSPDSSTATSSAEQPAVVRVGVNPTPGGEILAFVRDELAPDAGLTVEVVEFSDYVQPNLALQEKQIDANFFQHIPYMEDFSKERGIDMVAVTPVLIAPLGIYSSRYESLEQVPDQATIAIPNDATNLGRALRLLESQGLITIKSGLETELTIQDVEANPKQLRLEELEAAQLPRSLNDVDLAVINVNYALSANLNPAQDAIALESPENNPYVNVLTVLRDRENDPEIQTLAELLNSPELKQFIETEFDGSVIPAF